MKLAAIRIRSAIKADKEIRDALHLLRLRRRNVCVIYDDNPSIKGMLEKVKDFIAYGEIDKETFKQLLLKRGRLSGNKRFSEEYLKEKLNMNIDEFVEKFFNNQVSLKDIPDFKPFFRLNSPRNGFPRKGIKKPYSEGGALGYWGKDINKLIQSML